MDLAPYVFLVVVAVVIMASAVYALYWAVKTGQFARLDKDASIIFDDEEPVGRVTDRFPGLPADPSAPAPHQPTHP